jgi:hypothetical protein
MPKYEGFKNPPTERCINDVYRLFQGGLLFHEIVDATSMGDSPVYDSIQVMGMVLQYIEENDLQVNEVWDSWTSMALSNINHKSQKYQREISGLVHQEDAKTAIDTYKLLLSSLKEDKATIMELAKNQGKIFNSQKAKPKTANRTLFILAKREDKN